jgi:hypothetical protein
MTSKVTTQKIHKVLQTAGFVSDMYKPSAKINRRGYSLTTLAGFYGINPSGLYSTASIIEALNEAGIEAGERKGYVTVKKFQA